MRAAVELAKQWRQDKALRFLQVGAALLDARPLFAQVIGCVHCEGQFSQTVPGQGAALHPGSDPLDCILFCKPRTAFQIR